MKSICNSDCCDKCPKKDICGGCIKCDGHPFNGECVAANCIKKYSFDKYIELKNTLIKEVNDLGIKDLVVNDLYLLNGEYVNLEYEINGNKIKLLNDKNIYLGNQIEKENSDRCLGVACSEDFIVVSEYGQLGIDPVLVEYKKR